MFVTSHMIEFKPYARHHYLRNLPEPITAQECEEHCANELLEKKKRDNIPIDCELPLELDPKIAVTDLMPKQVDAFVKNATDGDCFKQHPRCFIIMLRQFYPDLYHSLREMTRARMTQRLAETYLHTTYQIDFDHAVEYPDPVDCKHLLPPLPELPEKFMLDVSTCAAVRAMNKCDIFRMKVMNELVKEDKSLLYALPYKPFFGRTNNFGDGSQFVGAGSSRWVPRDRINRWNHTEYMDTISKTGCVITKNNLHIHTECEGGRRCLHHLDHKCKFLH